MIGGGITGNIRVAFYVRVSTEEQKKDGYGPEMQMHGLTEMIKYRGDLSGWTHDKKHEYLDLGCTGADLNRGEYKRMMEGARKGEFDMIAVWKIDRLSRNLSHLLSTFEILQNHKISFFSLKENIDFTGPIGKLTFQIFGALAEFEREMIRTRTSEGKKQSARMGNYVLNKTPFGYKKEDAEKKRNRSLQIIEGEALWVKRIYDEFIHGKSLEQLAKVMNEGSVLKNTGNLKKERTSKWYGSTIKAILINPAYTGRAVYRSKEDDGTIDKIEIAVPRIITDLTFELARNRLENLQNEAERGGGENQYLLSRKIIDMETGRKFVGVIRSKDKKISYRRKNIIIDGKQYKNMEIPGEAIEKFVWNKVGQMIHRPKELFELFRKQSGESQEYDILLKQREINEKEIQKLQQKEDKIDMDYYDGEMDEEKKDRLTTLTKNQRQALEKRNEELDEQINAVLKMEETKLAFEQFEGELETNIENLSFEQKKMLIDHLVEIIEVTTVSSQLHLNIKFRFDQSRIGVNASEIEPKKSSTEPQSDDGRADFDDYGRSNRKGYIRMGVYYKLRKLQIGNRWKTQFVTLHREEVRRLEERREMEQNGTRRDSVQNYLESISPYEQNLQGYSP